MHTERCIELSYCKKRFRAAHIIPTAIYFMNGHISNDRFRNINGKYDIESNSKPSNP